jgi:transposase
MICPHCNKVIVKHTWKITDDTKKKIINLHKKGYSARDIQHELGVSFSSAARIIREHNKK